MIAPFRVHFSCSQELRSRPLWALALLALGLTAALTGIRPFGISIETSGASMFRETAFLAGLAGCCLGTLRVDRTRTVLARASQARRFWFEFGTIATATTLTALLATIPIIMTAGSRPPVIPSILVLAHLTAMALLLVRLKLHPGTATLLLPLLAWITPAFLGTSDPRLLIRILRAAVDPTQNTALLSTAESLGAPLLASISPIIALLGLRVAIGAQHQSSS